MKTESKYLNFYQKSSFLLRFLQFSQKYEYFCGVKYRYSYYQEWLQVINEK